MIKKLLILTTVVLSACSTNVNQSKQVDTRPNTDNNIKLSFKTKALVDNKVKSIEAFLSSNPSDPFASGANPLGDNTILKTNIVSGSNTTLSFSGFQGGGPFYAFIAAFDDLIDSPTRNNITRVDNSLISTDKKWSRSFNSVTSNLIYSDGGSQLKVKLQLEIFNQTDISVQPIDGIVPSAPITVIRKN